MPACRERLSSNFRWKFRKLPLRIQERDSGLGAGKPGGPLDKMLAGWGRRTLDKRAAVDCDVDQILNSPES